MKRRFFMQALAVAPATPALLTKRTLAQQPAPPTEAAPAPLRFAVADDVAETVLTFFDQRQFATLRRLSEILSPAMVGNPSALDAHVPEFLDFHLSESPTARQQLYQSGLDALEYQSQTILRKPFAEASKSEAERLISPLRQKWTYAAPNPFVEFLRTARTDVRNATMNSREYAVAASTRAPAGQYWKAVE